jgi:hypothetical protein
MSGQKVVRDFVRDSSGAGVNGASWSAKALAGNVAIASGTTASDTDPTTPLAGMLAADETTLANAGTSYAYPGPISYTVTEPVSGAVRVHSSKSVGIVGSWRSIDIPRAWRTLGTGVMPGQLDELAVTTNGANMVIAVASGACVVAMADAALLYSYPAAQSLTAGAADATNPRIDTVCLRFYPPGVATEGRIYLELVAGTPAASPVAPTLRQSTDYWQHPLADVRVNAGVTTLAADKVTDRRTYCLLYPSGITAGDLFYVDATGKLARLAAGTSGQYLKQGATIPAWDTITIDEIKAAISDTELGYLDGVTSAIQTQLDAKQGLDAQLTDIAGLTPTDNGVVIGNGSNFVVESGATLKTSLGLTVGTDVAPVANPTFTGTVTVAALTATGDVNLGNATGDTITLTGHLETAGSAPSIAANAGAGSGASASISGNDTRGTITVTTGTGPSGGVNFFTVTNFVARASTTYKVFLMPFEDNAASLSKQPFPNEAGFATTFWTARLPSSGSGIAASTTYKWQYWIIG